MDAGSLPGPLRALADALEPGIIRTRPDGYGAGGFAESPFVAAPGLPPHDGIYRGSFYETGIFLRLDLSSACVARALADELRRASPELVGGDGALYEYERATRSQLTNRGVALTRLADRVAQALTAAP